MPGMAKVLGLLNLLIDNLTLMHGTYTLLHVIQQQQLVCAQGEAAPSSQQAAGAAGEVKPTSLRVRFKLGAPKLGVDENKPLAAKGGTVKPAQASRRARRTRSLRELLAEPPASAQAQQQGSAALDGASQRPQVWLHTQQGQHRVLLHV